MPAVRKTTDQQLRMLLDFMGRNVEIAHAKVPHHGKAVMNAKWNELAHKLNAIGPAKPPVYWRHYWHEMKYKTKLKAMKVKKSIINCEDVRLPKFTEFEDRVLEVIGVTLPKRPRSPIPVIVKRRSQSAIGSDDDTAEKSTGVWSHKFVKTKTEPGSHENSDNNEYNMNDPFPQSVHSGNGGSQDSTHLSTNDDSNILAWAHQLEKQRIESENRLADAMFAVAKSQSEMAQAQRLMADALDDIRKDIKMYLRPESQNPAMLHHGDDYSQSQQ